MNKIEKLIVIALALAMANLMILDGIVENECTIHRPLKCVTSLDSEARICK